MQRCVTADTSCGPLSLQSVPVPFVTVFGLWSDHAS
jgi:hypothetical protein